MCVPGKSSCALRKQSFHGFNISAHGSNHERCPSELVPVGMHAYMTLYDTQETCMTFDLQINVAIEFLPVACMFYECITHMHMWICDDGGDRACSCIVCCN